MSIGVLVIPACRPAQRPEPLGSQAKSATMELAKDRDVQKAFIDGRKAMLNQPDMKSAILQENIDEQKAMAADPNFIPQQIALYLELNRRATESPETAKQVRALNLKIMNEIMKDPQLRPQMLLLMSEIIRDPKMRTEVESMVRGMLPRPAQTPVVPPAPGPSSSTPSSGSNGSTENSLRSSKGPTTTPATSGKEPAITPTTTGKEPATGPGNQKPR